MCVLVLAYLFCGYCVSLLCLVHGSVCIKCASVCTFLCPLRAKCGPIVCVSCLFLFSCLPLLLSVPNSEMSRQPMGQLLGQPGKCCFFIQLPHSNPMQTTDSPTPKLWMVARSLGFSPNIHWETLSFELLQGGHTSILRSANGAATCSHMTLSD